MIINSPAKINLTLDVLGRFPNGYHELETIMSLIGLCDTLEIIIKNGSPEIKLFCDYDYKAQEIPEKENLVYRAAALINEYDKKKIIINLYKRIPIGGGLGGGSSNGAAVLYWINKILDLKISYNKLSEYAFSLGADAPFFLYCLENKINTAFAKGVGEKLSSLDAPEVFFIIIIPNIFASTREVFRAYKLSPPRYSSQKMSELLRKGGTKKNFLDFLSVLHNDLAPSAFELFPDLKKILDVLAQENSYDIMNAVMSGSGSTFFACYDSLEARSKALKRLSSRLLDCLCLEV